MPWWIFYCQTPGVMCEMALERFWPPTSIHALILRAALLAAPPALEAWQDWCDRVDIEHCHPDANSFQLLGRVWHNLHSTAPDDPLMGRLRGIWRRNWYVNQGRLQAAVEAIESLKRAGVSSLLADDGVTSGLRALDAETLLVRPAHAPNALAVLVAAGWCARSAPPGWVNLMPARMLIRADGQSLRVQWRLIAHDAHPDADEAVWADARPVLWQGQPAMQPAPVDQLLAWCSDVVGAPPHCGWFRLADMAALLQARESELDGDTLLQRAAVRRMAGLLRLTLDYLADLGVVVPPNVRESLRRLPPSAAEQSFWAAGQQSLTLMRRIRLSWRHWRLTQENAGWSDLWTVAMFGPHLRCAPDRFGVRAAVRKSLLPDR